MTLFAHFNKKTQEYEAYAWPGSCPMYYITADGGILCPPCATENRERDIKDDPQWYIVRAGANYEDPDLYCDHCSLLIECAYVPNGAHAIKCPARPLESKEECTCETELRKVEEWCTAYKPQLPERIEKGE